MSFTVKMALKSKNKSTKKLSAKKKDTKLKKEKTVALSLVQDKSDLSKRNALKGFHIPKNKKAASPSKTVPVIELKIKKEENRECFRREDVQIFVSRTESDNEVFKDIPNSQPVEVKDEDEPFYEDFKRKRRECRPKVCKEAEEPIVKSSQTHSERYEKFQPEQKTSPHVHEISFEIKRKKKDPPLRTSHTISANPPEISSEEDVEEELRALLKRKCSEKAKKSEIQTKNLKAKNKEPPSSKRIVARYTRNSHRQGKVALSDPNLSGSKIKRTSNDQGILLQDDYKLNLNITPDNPPTPPLINNDNEDYSQHWSKSDENATFSPNTTISESNLFNQSFGGSTSEKIDTTTNNKDSVQSEEDNNKSSQELNSSFIEKIINNGNEYNFEDETPMDWDATAAMGILSELKQCREDLQRNPSCSTIPVAFENIHASSTINDPRTKVANTIYVVIDTNIFIAQLRMIDKLLANYYNSFEEHGFAVKLFIPWAVLDELDKLKLAGSRSHNPNMELELNARKAIGFLHEKLISKNPMLAGQTQAEEQEAEIYKAHNADDRILRTCLQIKADGKCVLLYTNDRNLANKTIISGIYSYDSTKILKGIIETAKELKNCLRSDAQKSNIPDNILDSAHNHISISLNENILDQTLIPDNEVEEDMIIDSDDFIIQGRNPESKGSTVLDLLQLFQDVWYIIYKYTCRYAIAMDIPLGNLPQPVDSELPPILVPRNNTKHLNQLVNGVMQLTKSLNEFLKINPTSLAVNSKELTSFHGCLTLFLVKLDRFKPCNHPSSPDHPPIRPSVMLSFALQPMYREKLNSGLNQLVELRAILHCCKEKSS